MSRLGFPPGTVVSSAGDVPLLRLSCSCKPDKISSIFSSFNKQKSKQKNDMVTRIGFGGLLKIPLVEKLNLDLCLWLLQIADFKNKCLHIPGGVDLPFDFPDVHLVLGIPCAGVSVFYNQFQSRETLNAFTRKLFSVSTSSSLTMSFLEEVLTRDYGSNMSNDEIDVFNIAIVLYSCTYLLAPRRRHFFPFQLLQNFVPQVKPAGINWASLVLGTLDQASSVAKQQFKNGRDEIILFGCCLFLQVLYIDNLNFGPSSPCHDHLPRASAYLPELMDDLIVSDCISTSDEKLMLFGKTEVRPAFDVIYTRGLEEHVAKFDQLEQLSDSDWNNTTEMTIQGLCMLERLSVRSGHRNIAHLDEAQLDEAIESERRTYLLFQSMNEAAMERLSTKVVDFIKRRNVILYGDYIHKKFTSAPYKKPFIELGARPIRLQPNKCGSPLRRKIERPRKQTLQFLINSGLTTEQAFQELSIKYQHDHGES